MSILSLSKRAEVIAHLCEGAGIRATSRLSDVSKPTILALLLKIGAGCDRLHDKLVRDLDIREIQCDEIWSYVQKKQARVKPTDDLTFGDAYTWLGIARTQKLIVSYLVGKRDDASGDAFVMDLRARLVTVPHISADGFSAYPKAVGAHFEACDFSVVHKDYSRSPRRVRDGQHTDHRYEPARNPFITRTATFGAPDMSRCSTSHVERLNLDVRMSTRRLTRLCNGFSRKLTHHAAAISLFVAYHNFCKIHGALRVTPAMEAGITSSPWTVEQLVEHALAALDDTTIAPPVKVPLRLPETPAEKPAAPARQTSTGGWLRLVTGGAGPFTVKGPTPAPEPTPAAPGEESNGRLFSEEPVAPEPAQLDLLAWRPKARPLPPPGTQLSLFSDFHRET